MANYEALRAFARGMMEGLAHFDETPTPQQQQQQLTAIAQADIEAACERVIRRLVAEPDQAAPPEPNAYVENEPPAWMPPDMQEVVRDTVGEVRDLEDNAFRYRDADEREPGTYDPNMPGTAQAWAEPRE